MIPDDETPYQAVRERMERFFGGDGHRIAHALEVTRRALAIQGAEGGDREIVTMAALLHDVGIKPAEERYGRNDGKMQEELGPPVAGAILEALGTDAAKIETVKELIAHHHTPGKITTKEFACLWDADLLVNLTETVPRMAPEKIRALIEAKFLTREGKRLARATFLPGG